MTSRDEFEAWAKDKYMVLSKKGDEYYYSDTMIAWESWQAARAWKPIESAPRIGDYVLLKIDGIVQMNIFKYCVDPYGDHYFVDASLDYDSFRINNNIEWQHLPE